MLLFVCASWGPSSPLNYNNAMRVDKSKGGRSVKKTRDTIVAVLSEQARDLH